MEKKQTISTVTAFLPQRIKYPVEAMSCDVISQIKEIRIKKSYAVSVITLNENYFLKYNGQLTKHCDDAGVCIAQPHDVDELVRRLCNFSLHSYQNELINGYITIDGGHRVGVCASAVTDSSGNITAVKNVSSINIRIAREISGAADDLLNLIYKSSIKSVLIVGEPSSGKTTILRDAACRLAGREFDYLRICVVDERREIFSANTAGQGIGSSGCDILDGYPKADGMMIALRAMSPDIIVCDEIGDENDVHAVEKVANAGVNLLATIHANSFSQLIKRPQFQRLMNTGAFDVAVILEGKKSPCNIKEIVSLKKYWR